MVSIARLPVTGRDLFGREHELAWLDQCWADGVRVASIVAWGGVGKSALVNAWLRRIEKDGWRGAERVFGWSFYSQGTTDRHTSADVFVDAALRWFGDTDPSAGSPWAKGERLAALVRKQRTILVLDAGGSRSRDKPDGKAARLKDAALGALVRELSVQSGGLCVLTTRVKVGDLETWMGDKVDEKDLTHLPHEAGAEVLRKHGALGPEGELREASGEYDGHALSLDLSLGSYLRRAHKGDIRKRHLIPPLTGEPAHRMMAIYEQWFEGKPELSVLRMLGLFDRPASEDEIAALRAARVVPGLTDALAGLSQGAWNEAVTGAAGRGSPGGRLGDGRRRRGSTPDSAGAGALRGAARAGAAGGMEGGAPAVVRAPRGGRREGSSPIRSRRWRRCSAAVAHGCSAGCHLDALCQILSAPDLAGDDAYYATMNLGAVGADLAALAGFFSSPWTDVVPSVMDRVQSVGAQRGWASICARWDARGKLLQPMLASLNVAACVARSGVMPHTPPGI